MAQAPRTLAAVNKRITNRVQGLWAPYLPPWAVVEHTGRRSGRHFRTPVVATIDGRTVYVAILYGEESDWVRNLLAAGGGTLQRAGARHRITQPEIRRGEWAPGLVGTVASRVSGRVLRGKLQRI